MQDEPKPQAILHAVAQFLRETAGQGLPGRTAFLLRVAANAIDLVRRQIELEPGFDAAELARLKSLLGREGDLGALNKELCEMIESGRMTLETPGLEAHLRATSLAKLAVDQPRYSAYIAARARGEGGANET